MQLQWRNTVNLYRRHNNKLEATGLIWQLDLAIYGRSEAIVLLAAQLPANEEHCSSSTKFYFRCRTLQMCHELKNKSQLNNEHKSNFLTHTMHMNLQAMDAA